MTFQYISATDDQKSLMQKFRDAYEALNNSIVDEVNDSRGRKLAMTKLEESSFWLNKSITQNDGILIDTGKESE